MSLSRQAWAPLYFSLRVALFTPTFHCRACPPMLSYNNNNINNNNNISLHTVRKIY